MVHCTVSVRFQTLGVAAVRPLTEQTVLQRRAFAEIQGVAQPLRRSSCKTVVVGGHAAARRGQPLEQGCAHRAERWHTAQTPLPFFAHRFRTTDSGNPMSLDPRLPVAADTACAGSVPHVATVVPRRRFIAGASALVGSTAIGLPARAAGKRVPRKGSAQVRLHQADRLRAAGHRLRKALLRGRGPERHARSAGQLEGAARPRDRRPARRRAHAGRPAAGRDHRLRHQGRRRHRVQHGPERQRHHGVERGLGRDEAAPADRRRQGRCTRSRPTR